MAAPGGEFTLTGRPVSALPEIYLDYQASTPVDPDVSAVVASVMGQCFANPHSSDHVAGWHASEIVEASTQRIAGVLGADADEIIYTSGATEANNLAVLGLARRARSRNRILVSTIEHKSVVAAARAAASMGASLEEIPVDGQGYVDLDYLERAVDDDVLLVSVVAVNNEIGTIQPLREVARLAHSSGAYLHSDAAQALAAMVPHVDEWEVDLLSISGHKVYGPKGIGALFIRRNTQRDIEPLLYGGGQQNHLRPGTLPVPLCAGLAEAIVRMTGERAEEERLLVRRLRDAFVSRLLREDERIGLNGPPLESRHPGNANMRFAGVDARDLLAVLQPSIAASSGSACVSGEDEPSHVLRATGLTEAESRSSVRFSFGRFSTEADVDAAVALVVGALRRLD